MWDWSRPEPEHTPHRGRATRAHTCTRARICARTDARTEAHLHLQPDQQRDRADMRAHTHTHAHTRTRTPQAHRSAQSAPATTHQEAVMGRYC